MRFLLFLFLGFASGVLCGLAGVYYNPASSAEAINPLMVSDRRQVILNYSAVAADAILYTNNGESHVKPTPQKVAQLWEAPIRNTEVLVAELYDYRGATIGIGIKFSTRSEETSLLNGEAIVDSAWHINLPGRGTLLVAQRENHWEYLRDIVIPAHWSSSDSWRGNWRGLLSAGPNALGTAKVIGGSGTFAGATMEAVEYLAAKAYSVENGPVAADGQIVVELPEKSPQVVAGNETGS